ncbi:unnamed protein product, partial [Schistosoma margrebowiei]|uniref:Uncharacterized protein n=1 Tax=Schistosoma margrebowiei TaxID=48269 RepID=A0AA85AG48_9TREM
MRFEIFKFGQIHMYDQKKIGDIKNFLTDTPLVKTEISDQRMRKTKINVPGKWIQNGTLVEYEALGDCPKHNSNKACQEATTSNTTCIWWETANICITSNNKDSHEFKSSTVNVVTEPTTELKKTSPSTESHL